MMEEVYTHNAGKEWGSPDLASIVDAMKPMVDKYRQPKVYVPSMEHPLLVELRNKGAAVSTSLLSGIPVIESDIACLAARDAAIEEGLAITETCFINMNGDFYVVDKETTE